MNISDQGVQFICSFEGFRADPYPDPASGGEPYTIGYGTTIYPDGTKVTMADQPVTQDQAAGFLQDYINKNAAGWLNANLPDLTQTQFDSLCDFIYNLGLGNFQSSSLLRDIRAGASDDVITADFNKWVKAAGKVMPGLVKRRAAEASLYCNGVYNS